MSARRRVHRDEHGFTLVELLVVILIIGVIAAIALPTFLGQSNKAKDATAKSDARNALTQMEACLADDARTATDCADDASVTNHRLLTRHVGHGDGSFELVATSESGNAFTVTGGAAPFGIVRRTCDTSHGVAGAGCPASGSW